MNLKGKKAFITGGTRGIGRAIAIKLAESGCDLALNYLDNVEAADQTLELLKPFPVKVDLIQANLRDMLEAKKTAKQVLEIFGGHIDFFIHSAALGSFKKTCEIKPNQWDLSMDINVKAMLMICQVLKPAMPRGSSIIALSSSGSTKAVPNYGAIGISKAALESLVRYLAVDYAPDGVRVNAVSGGFIDTKSLTAFPEYERLKEEAIKRTPAGRIGTANDLAGIVRFLCTPEASWLCGQTILADGGMGLV